MRNKTLSGVLASLLILLSGQGDCWAGTKERPKAKKPTVNSESIVELSRSTGLFSDLIGEGARSTVYDAYHECFQNINSIKMESLKWLKENGTPGGRLYAGFLMLRKDPKAGRDAFIEFLTDNSPLQYQSGCEVLQATVSGIARNIIRTGRFLDFNDGTAHGVTHGSPIFVQELMVAEHLADAVPAESGPRREYLVFSAAKQNLKELKDEDLYHLLTKASPAGKIYAASLIGLKTSDSSAFDYLLSDKSQVVYTSGCQSFGSAVSEVAKQLKERGKFFGFSPKEG